MKHRTLASALLLHILLPGAVATGVGTDTPAPPVSAFSEMGPSESGRAAERPSHSPSKAPTGEVYVDLPCNVFTPGKADPFQWMASATIARLTFDGFNYQYGYDPLGQSYDMMVSGLADYSGILVQETVGVMAATIPAILTVDNVRRVEMWISVKESNLFPFELVGITALETVTPPSSSLNSIDMQLLYEDARGFSGAIYFDDHLSVGAHAIDLGPAAVAHLAARVDAPGWFGVGMAADGWDLSGSLGELVLWKAFGGGALPETIQPFFRVYYNAPPAPFALRSPADGERMATGVLSLRWDAANDPNGDSPIEYRVRLGSDPQLTSAFELGAGTSTSITLPFALADGVYYWEVIASDPDGAERSSDRWSLTLLEPTDAPPPSPTQARSLHAWPNPFNPQTTIRFELAATGPVQLAVYDVVGRRVRTLVEGGTRTEGSHQVEFDGKADDGRALPSGSYFAMLRAGGTTRTLKLSLIK